MLRLIGIIYICFYFGSTQAASTQSCETWSSWIDEAVQQRRDGGRIVGLIAVVALSDRDCVFKYGERDTYSRNRLSLDDFFELGSITKTFTGLLLAREIIKGRQSLTRPIVSFDSIDFPFNELITLEHLATHTAGIELSNTDLSWVKDIDNPFADFDRAKLYHQVEQARVQFKPGTSYLYSNLGSGLLGQLLSFDRKMSFEELLRNEILLPLGMIHSTNYWDVIGELVPGHRSDTLEEVSPWLFADAIAGAGGLRSNAREMKRYLRAQTFATGGPLGHEIRLSQTAVRQQPLCPQMALGLGWNIGLCEDNSTLASLRHHGGQTGGFRNFIGILPEAVGLLLLTNSSESHTSVPITDEVDQIGFSVLRRYQATR
jgi:serine-type D-Ala-D-Ala carboxypeptidase/endopeptidase